MTFNTHWLSLLFKNHKSRRTDGTSLRLALSHQATDDTSLWLALSHQATDDTSLWLALSHQATDDTSLWLVLSHQATDDTSLWPALSHQATDDTSLWLALSHQATVWRHCYIDIHFFCLSGIRLLPSTHFLITDKMSIHQNNAKLYIICP